MAQKFQKQKNLVRSPSEYSRYYGNFRGVDFSSDHTEVNEQRFAYSVNMYKDYHTGEGTSIETIPGFRRRFKTNVDNPNPKINGIHEFKYVNAKGEPITEIIVHTGQYLYKWNHQKSVNVKHVVSTVADTSDADYVVVQMDYDGYELIEYSIDQSTVIYSFRDLKEKDLIYETSGGKITLKFNKNTVTHIANAQAVHIYYYETKIGNENYINGSKLIENSKSISFTFNTDTHDRLYILDGNGYYVYEHFIENKTDKFEFKKVADSGSTYIPTTYKGLPVGDISPEDMSKYEYEQKNLLCNKYKHTYIADGSSDRYPIYDNDYDSFTVTVNNDLVIVEVEDGFIKFDSAPKIPDGKPEYYAGVEVTYTRKADTYAKELAKIEKCTVAATFDERVFLTGNHDYPNDIWYCGYNNETGYEDAQYFGDLDRVRCGVENAPITGLIPVADTLTVLKNNTKQDGSVYFLQRMETNERVIPVTYPAIPGLSGIGCVGACLNFLDDPVYVSDLGLEAIGQLSVRLERAVEHRSSLVDAKLVNLNLRSSRLAQYNGYLLLLVDGKIFMADSRQKYASDTGVVQYEWYYLEDIGIYEDQYKEYYFASHKYESLPDKVEKDGIEYEIDAANHIYNDYRLISENLCYSAVSETDENKVFEVSFEVDGVSYTAPFILLDTWDGKTVTNVGTPFIVRKAILCDDRGSYTGGTFYPATTIASIDGNVFFGTDNGYICSFNFDMREADGLIPARHYNFDNRTIFCGVATKMDNCGIPHLAKSTIKKSTVLKTKQMNSSTVKMKIRTNNEGYKSIARMNSRIFSFEDMDFSDFTFATDGQTIFTAREKEKHWVEKQHWIYSDEYQRPFALRYLAFRYKISGRIKK